MGESMVTPQMSINSMEDIFRDALKNRNFDIAEANTAVKPIFYLDLFVYQFPAEYPTISLTVRSELGIHYFERQNIKLYTNRKIAFLKIAQEMANALPQVFDKEKILNIGASDILLTITRMDLIHYTAKSMTADYREKYDNELKWNDTPIVFISGNFEDYFAFCMNYKGIREKLKGDDKIVLKLKICQNGLTTIENIESSFALTQADNERLHMAVNALPLWISPHSEVYADLIIDVLQ